MTVPSIDSVREDYRNFLAGRRTVTLATIDAAGQPFLAITPFVLAGDVLYIYVSEIAEHYEHLLRSPEVMVLLHADESDSRNLFAVERARFACTASKVADEGHEAIFDQLRADHNAALIDVLLGLDFHLFELRPTAGRYIVGFGKAFDLDLAASYVHHVVVDKSAESPKRI